MKPKSVEVVALDNQTGTLTLKLSKARLAEEHTASDSRRALHDPPSASSHQGIGAGGPREFR